MRYLVAVLLAAICSGACIADYCPPDSPESGGMRDIMLAYMASDRWAKDDFLPYVAYLDKARGGEVRDWFYDSFLFLMFGGAPSGGAYYNGTATKADWEFYLDLLFDPEYHLAGLNDCVAQVGEKLGEPDRVCPIMIMIPYMATDVENFGDVDGDGVDENPSDDADRVKAFKWLVDEFLTRYDPAKYPHLKLWGFYWMMEGASSADQEIVRSVASHVHDKGFGLHWIPWFRAPGHDRWREMDFDFIIMQPNFAFIRGLKGVVVPNEDRLTENSNSSREFGLGVEMELDTNTHLDPGKRLNLQLYLNHGVDELDGYMSGAVRAYYQAYQYIADLYRSDAPDCNRLYDDLYHFHKGDYQRRSVSMTDGASATLNDRPAPKLVDGLWMTRGERTDRLLSVPSPALVQVDLRARQIIGDVRVHVAGKAGDSPAVPRLIRLSTSTDGETFTPACERVAQATVRSGGWHAGFTLLTFEPRFAQFLRIEILGEEGSRVGVDEVVAFPAPHLLWGVPYELDGEAAQQEPALTGVELNDGRLTVAATGPEGAVQFADGSGTVRFNLSEAACLGSALAHARWADQGAAPRARLRLGEETVTQWSALSPDAGGWCEIPLGNVISSDVVFEVQGAADVAWDEMQLRRAPNLASGKPYVIEPPFAATYPDTDGRELTDGVLSNGFGDGRTVGWWQENVSVLLDLGETQTVDGIRVHTQGGGYAAVEYPTSLEAWGSEDGDTWKLLGSGEPAKEVTLSTPTGDGTQEMAWLGLEFEPAEARMVRTTVNGGPWLMLSEVQAQNKGQSISEGLRYSISPAPTSTEQYADSAARLTDGEYSRASAGWGKAVGWNNGSPQVTVDLMSTRKVGLVRVHCLGGGQAAVHFPRSLSFAFSEDGESWSDEIVSDARPPESGSESLVAFMQAEAGGCPARYVRVSIEPQNWAMLDEIEVYEAAR